MRRNCIESNKKMQCYNKLNLVIKDHGPGRRVNIINYKLYMLSLDKLTIYLTELQALHCCNRQIIMKRKLNIEDIVLGLRKEMFVFQIFVHNVWLNLYCSYTSQKSLFGNLPG